MFANQTSRHSIAVTRIAEAHARQMFLYYFLRALLEAPGGVADSERKVVHTAAIEARRLGFRIESNAEGIGLRLSDYDEENFRRETYRAANLSLTDEVPLSRAAHHRVLGGRLDGSALPGLTDSAMGEAGPWGIWGDDPGAA